MEPDVDGLPMWKPQAKGLLGTVMVHEGAKAARHADWLVNDTSYEARQARAKHPWSEDLSRYEHWGWIGGAPNPHRTDWSELSSVANLREIVVVTDNDLEGKKAISHIARQLKSLRAQVWEVRFNDAFPDGFDLADPLPEKFWHQGRYCGPTLRECKRSATWATRFVPPGDAGGRPTVVARSSFVAQWLVATKPQVFVHRGYPDRLLTAEEFNANVLPFSDAQDTARIMQREAAIQVDGVAYEPGKNAGTITMDGRMLVNMWTPTRVGRRRGDAKPFLEFMAHLIPVEKDREHVLKWVATLVARPDIRMRYGILMISKQQGVGKGTLMEAVLSPLVGRHNVSVPTESTLIKGDFNSWLVKKRLVLVHEIYAGQAKKAYDNIKSWVTQDDVNANEKYLPEYLIHNWSHYCSRLTRSKPCGW